jgi:hypothetical protein
LERLGRRAPVCVLTTWSYSYLSMEQRRRFVEHLAAEGRARPVVWVAGDGPGIVESVDAPSDAAAAGPGDGEVLTAMTFDRTDTDAGVLARVHPHGLWMRWQT